jgi:hypothetical protein
MQEQVVILFMIEISSTIAKRWVRNNHTHRQTDVGFFAIQDAARGLVDGLPGLGHCALRVVPIKDTACSLLFIVVLRAKRELCVCVCVCVWVGVCGVKPAFAPTFRLWPSPSRNPPFACTSGISPSRIRRPMSSAMLFFCFSQKTKSVGGEMVACQALVSLHLISWFAGLVRQHMSNSHEKKPSYRYSSSSMSGHTNYLVANTGMWQCRG